MEVNVTGTQRLLEAAAAASVTHVIDGSSIAVCANPIPTSC
jgi:nucleoside-diphosphate-sugar epimerase